MDGSSFEKNRPAPLMTLDEVAEFLNLSPRTVWGKSSPRGTIPVIQIGRSIRYCPNAIQEWMSQQMAAYGSKSMSA